MRKPMVALVALGLLVAGAWTVGAATPGGRTPVNCQDARWRGVEASTSSTTWEDVPGFTASPVAIYPITVHVSALVSDAPAWFRVLSTNIGGQTFVSKPGPTRVDPGTGGPDAFAYTWVERNDVATPHANTIRLQWRSATGATVRLLSGDMTLAYHTDVCVGSS